MVLKNIALFLFILASVAMLIGLSSTPLSYYSKFVAVNETSQQTTIGLSATDFMANIITTFLAAVAGAAVLGFLFNGNAQFTVLSAIVLFILQNLLPIPLAIFTDPNIPFAAQLLLGGSISILIIYALLELFSGRQT